MKKIISTEKAPKAIGPYSQAVLLNGVVYCSGQIPLDPRSMEIVGKTAKEQAVQVNEVYGSNFTSEPPARETVAVQTLPKNVLVEISCIAHL